MYIEARSQFIDKHSSAPKDFSNNFSISKKCKSKFDSLVFETFLINELRRSTMYNQAHFVQIFQIIAFFKQLFKLDSIVVLFLHALLLLSFSNIFYSP